MQLPLSCVNTLSKHQAALVYSQIFGIRVFPLQPGTKVPFPYSHGVHGATTDYETVHSWWKSYPDANIGLAAGDNFDFADLDCKRNGQEGLKSWLEVDDDLIGRPVQHTPSGGLHVVLPHHTWMGLTNFQNKGHARGIDLRTTGGYVVGAPSSTAEGSWYWEDGHLKELGAGLAQALMSWSATGERTIREVSVPQTASLSSEDRENLWGQLPSVMRNFALNGVNWRDDGDDSTSAWIVALEMFKRGWSNETVAALVEDSYFIEMANRHAGPSRTPESWLWKYTLSSAQERADTELRLQREWMTDKKEALPWDDVGGWDDVPPLNRVAQGEEETTNEGHYANPIEIARQRLGSIDANDPARHRQADEILEGVAGLAADRGVWEDLLHHAHRCTGIRLGYLRESLEISQTRARQRRFQEEGEVPEIFIANQNRVLNRVSMTYRTKEAFLIEHAHEFGGDKNACEDHYLKGANRQCLVVDSAIYHPGKMHGVFLDDDGVTKYNFYCAANRIPRAGNAWLWLKLLDALDFEGGWKSREHLLNYLAYLIQNPGEKINHALLIGGSHGIGKDSLIYPIAEIFGERNVQQVRGDELTSDFTSYLARKKLIILQEVEYGDDREGRKVSAKLKPILAAPPNLIRINEKNLPEYETPNLIQIIAFTNERAKPIHMDPGERRWACLWAQRESAVPGSEEARKRDQWFEAYYRWLETGGIEEIYHYLLERDVSKFSPKSTPMETDWSLQIQTAGRSSLEEWLIDSIAFAQDIWAFDVVRLSDVQRLANLAAISGEIVVRGSRVSYQELSHSFEKIGVPRWRTRYGNWRIIRNAETWMKEKDPKNAHYWDAVFRAIDRVGATAAQALETKELLQRYAPVRGRLAREAHVIDFPVDPVREGRERYSWE